MSKSSQSQFKLQGISVLGVFIFAGLFSLGFLLHGAVKTFKQFERTVAVKGLSEREELADIVIWPIKFSVFSNSTLPDVYLGLEDSNSKIKKFLVSKGIDENELSSAPPFVQDKVARSYNNRTQPQFRYIADQVITVYSDNIELVRKLITEIPELGKQGIVFSGTEYEAKPQYLFTRLNEIKPSMIEEATMNARKSAVKFAEDSKSRLGKIKSANQGQFSISERDQNNPHIKKVRVVSTIRYYLTD